MLVLPSVLTWYFFIDPTRLAPLRAGRAPATDRLRDAVGNGSRREGHRSLPCAGARRERFLRKIDKHIARLVKTRRVPCTTSVCSCRYRKPSPHGHGF